MTPIQQWTDNDWAAIGTVVAAIGTVGAFLVGLYLVGVQVIDRRRAQARLVNAWLKEMRIEAKPLPVFVIRVVIPAPSPRTES